MKNIKIYSLLACLCLLTQSCLFSEDDVFDDSSAQRAMASVDECHAALQSASNGWLMEYYPGDGPEFGGYNLIAKFGDDYVELASEMTTDNYAAGEVCTTLYKVVSFQGTELSFDSHNELIHMFCEPNGYNDPGYAGDYEFIFRSVSKEKIVLTGKKRGNTLVMTPLSADTDWKDFLNGINRIKDDAPYATYKLKIGGTEVVNMFRSEHALTVTSVDDRGQATTVRYPYIYTEEGIKMFEPMEINGTVMTQFVWDSAKRTFVCTDEGVSASVEFYCPANYPNYVGTYRMRYGSSQSTVTISQKIEGVSYTLRGLPQFDIEVSFNFDTECIDLLHQYLGKYGSYQVYLCPWDAAAGYLTWSEGTGLSGYITSQGTDPMTIEFEDNGVYGSASSLLYYAFTGSPSSDTAAGSLLQIPYPTLQKISN